MADPAWGTQLSLSEDKTTRVLSAFHRREPLPSQHHWPLEQRHQQPAASLCQPLSEDNEMHHLCARNAQATDSSSYFEYPMHRIAPFSIQRNDAASMLVEMSSLASNDWQGLQQGAIKQQQPDLQAQTQQHKQRDVQLQIDRLQIRMQQMRQTQRKHQMQNQRQMMQPSYKSGMSDTKQMMWSNGAHTQRWQNKAVRANSGRTLQRQQLSKFPATAFPLFATGYGGNFLVKLPMSRNETMLTPQRIQPQLQTRNHEMCPSTAHYREDECSTLFTKLPIDTTPVSQVRKEHQCLSQQPQLYRVTEGTKRIRQEATSIQTAKSSYHSEFALSKIMKQFYTSVQPAVQISSALPTGALYETSVKNVATHNIETTFNTVTATTRIHPPIEPQMYNAQARPPLSPTRTTVVPGISLATESVRLVTMQDLLNGDDESINIDLNGGKQKRARVDRRTLTEKAAIIHQRRSQRQYKQSFQPHPVNHRVEDIQLRQCATSASVGALDLSTELYAPMYRAYLGSGPARMAAVQTNGFSNVIPNKVHSQSIRRQERVPENQSGSRQKVQAIPVTARNSNLVKQIALARTSTTYQVDSHLAVGTSAQLHAKARSKFASAKNVSKCSQPTNTKDSRSSGKIHTFIESESHVGKKCDHLTNEAFKEHRPEYSQQISYSIGKENGGKQRRRAKLPTSHFQRSTLNSTQQEAGSIPLSNEDRQVSGSQKTSALNLPSANRISPVLDASRAENRTVVIFCKRDFMRYQAMKIWRRYQEQLEKREQWREVRVAGKRTRYLNSRYDDLQRTHKRSSHELANRVEINNRSVVNGSFVSSNLRDSSVKLGWLSVCSLRQQSSVSSRSSLNTTKAGFTFRNKATRAVRSFASNSTMRS